MNIERDKFLSEAMGECWHEPYFDMEESTWVGEAEMKWNNNFSAWEGYSKLWEWSKKQDWWGVFKQTKMLELHLCKDFAWCNPDTFANAIYEFLQENQKDF